MKEKEHLHHVLIEYLNDNKNELYRLVFHAVFEANPSLFTEVLEMGKLQLDPETQKKVDEYIRDRGLDKKWAEEEQLKAKLKIALNLLSKGMSIEEVSEVTDLPLNRLKQLKS